MVAKLTAENHWLLRPRDYREYKDIIDVWSVCQNIKRYLHQQTLKFGKAEMELDEALSGPIEKWNININQIP